MLFLCEKPCCDIHTQARVSFANFCISVVQLTATNFRDWFWDQAWNNKAARPRQVLGTRVSIFQIRVCLFTLDLQYISYFKADNDQNVNAILSPNLKHSWNSIPISNPRQEAQEILINAQARVPFANVWSSIVWLTVLYSHCYIDWQKPVSDSQAQKSAFCKLQAE